MKRNTTDHPKVLELQALLGCSKPLAVGILACLWDWTAKYAVNGDLSRYSYAIIGRAIGYEGDPQVLIESLVGSRWLDQTETGLFVHDWVDHCEDSVHRSLARQGKRFGSGDIPKLTRLSAEERARIEGAYQGQNGNVRPTCARRAPDVRPAQNPEPRTQNR